MFKEELVINKSYAWNLALIQACAALVFSRHNPVLALVFLSGVIFQLNMMNIFRKHEINVKAKDLFEDNERTNKLREMMQGDPEFSNALNFVASLDSNQFIVFSRLIVEVRNERNRRVLKDLSSQYRREK